MTISYSTDNIFRLLLRWKGSIWKSVWRELFVFLALFFVIRLIYTILIPILDPEGDRALRQVAKRITWHRLLATTPPSRMMKSISKLKFARAPINPFKFFKISFEHLSRMFEDYTKMIPLTFLLGFYVSNVVSRWWQQFEAIAWPEDFISSVCAVFPGEDEKSRRRRFAIARYVNLTAALAWRNISQPMQRRFPTLQHLIDAGLMTEKEFTQLKSVKEEAVYWMVPLQWIQKILADELKENTPIAAMIGLFANDLKLYRISFRRLFCYDWVCVPLVYTQVAALATYAYFGFCLIGRQHLYPDNNRIDMIFPLFTAVQFLFFVGWFRVGQDLMRPFGRDDDDIEVNYIFDRNVRVSFALINEVQQQTVELDDDDIFWKSRNGPVPVIAHTRRSRRMSEHPPKSHWGSPEKKLSMFQKLPLIRQSTLPTTEDMPSSESQLKHDEDCKYLSW